VLNLRGMGRGRKATKNETSPWWPKTKRILRRTKKTETPRGGRSKSRQNCPKKFIYPKQPSRAFPRICNGIAGCLVLFPGRPLARVESFLKREKGPGLLWSLGSVGDGERGYSLGWWVPSDRFLLPGGGGFRIPGRPDFQPRSV